MRSPRVPLLAPPDVGPELPDGLCVCYRVVVIAGTHRIDEN